MEPRVLSIQSHVVSGYCGNRSAVFPLQLLGFEVDFINSVQFSNHTWYKVFKGQVLNADDLDTLFSGLRENGLDKYTHVLTGYIGDQSFLHKVCEIITELKQKNPGLIYEYEEQNNFVDKLKIRFWKIHHMMVDTSCDESTWEFKLCDPVMGDDDVWYVPKDLLSVYQEKVLPLADVIVPNQWEAEQLLGEKISNQAEAINAIKSLHAKGPHTVALSSTNLADNETELVGFTSTISKDGSRECVKTKVSKIPAMFIGTGDLFAALYLAWSYKYPHNLKKVMSKVQSTMCSVLDTTYKLAQERAGAGNKPSWADLELKLIQTKAVIEEGPETVSVQELAN